MFGLLITFFRGILLSIVSDYNYFLINFKLIPPISISFVPISQTRKKKPQIAAFFFVVVLHKLIHMAIKLLHNL